MSEIKEKFNVTEVEKPDINLGRDWEIIKIIAKLVGGDFNMEVKIGKPGEGSFFDSETCSITFDPIHIRENSDLAKFVAGHEGAHRAITPGPRELGLSLEKTRELYSQIGFGYLQNIIEDAAVNDWLKERFPGFREYVKKIYDEQLEKEEAVFSTPEIERIIESLGYVPRFVQYGSEIIRDWHQGRFRDNLDPKVQRALERTIEYARESIRTIPNPLKPGLNRREIITFAQKRFENNTNWIWPEVKKLVEMDLHTEEHRQMLQEFKKNQKELQQKRRELEQARKQGDQQAIQELQGRISELERELESFNELPDDVRKELQEQIDKAVRETAERLSNNVKEKQEQIEQAKQKQEELEREIQELEERAKSASGKEKQEIENQIQKKMAEKLSQEMKQRQAEQELRDLQSSLEDIQSGEQVPYPEDRLSPETKQELERLFRKLPKRKQRELKEKSKKQLEDAMNKEIEGKLNKDKVESHQERRVREQMEKERKSRKKRVENLAEKLEQIRKEKMTEYDKAYEEVADVINSLYNRLKRFFLPKRHPKWKSGFPSGSRIDLQKIMQAEADPRYLEKIWQRKTIPNKFDYRFSILVDLSGSMMGEKIEETFKALVALAEVLDKLGIQYEIIGFQDDIIPYKNFEDKLNKQIRDRIAVAKKEPYNQGIHNKAAYNSDGYVLFQTYERLKQNLGKDNFLIVLSDGVPEPDPAHSGEEWDLKRIVKNIEEEGLVKLIGIGLGFGTEHVNDYYPNSFANIKMKVNDEERRQGQKDFAEEFADLLEDMVIHPEKY